MKNKIIPVVLSALAVTASCCAGQLMPCETTAMDELMPRPAQVVVNRNQTVAAERLRNVVVAHGEVPGAPAATTDEAYVLEIASDGARITAPGPFGERWARVTLDQLVRLSRDGQVPCGRIVDWPRLKWRGFMLVSTSP